MCLLSLGQVETKLSMAESSIPSQVRVHSTATALTVPELTSVFPSNPYLITSTALQLATDKG